ncbi:MAG: hypothetical protein ABI528_05035 [bacterium]
MTGSLIISGAFKKPGTGFFNTVLLSMVVRMLVTTGLVFLMVYVLKLDKIGFAVIFFFFYFLFLIFEINFLSANINKK